MSADELLCASLFLLIHNAELECGKETDTNLTLSYLIFRLRLKVSNTVD